MLTKEVSQKYFNNALDFMHSTRANSLFETCWTLTGQANLTLSSLGSNKSGDAYVKHKIKSVDRLLGNSLLHEEIPSIYNNFYQSFISVMSTLYIIIDWSGCCRQDIHMLRASIVHNGRSITIYNEVHPVEKLGNTKVQNKFLQQLKKHIPIDKKVVIITDAGFAMPWFKAVLKLGWEYIGRLRSNIKIFFEDRQRWMQTKNLYAKAKKQGNYDGKAIIGRQTATPVQGHIYSYKQKSAKGTPQKNKCKSGDVYKRHSKANKIPWVLATSLSGYGKDCIKKIYSYRMQIEQTFRDDKSPRFGLGWRFSGSNNIKRVSVLCLIANIASFFLLTLGMVAEKCKEHRKYQVNTVREKRVLSFLNLAKQILRQGVPNKVIDEYNKGLSQLINSAEALYGI
jgi:hypothetical protein